MHDYACNLEKLKAQIALACAVHSYNHPYFCLPCIPCYLRPEFFLLVDLREFFSDLGLGGRGDEKKSSKNDQLTGHFQSFFLISPEKLVR